MVARAGFLYLGLRVEVGPGAGRWGRQAGSERLPSSLPLTAAGG